MSASAGDFAYFEAAEPAPIGPPKAGSDAGDFCYFDAGEPFRYIVVAAAAGGATPRLRTLMGVGA